MTYNNKQVVFYFIIIFFYKMKELLNDVKTLMDNVDLKSLVKTRLSEFKAFQKKSKEEIFKEICFCIMTANCSAEKCIEIHEMIGNEFLHLDDEMLSKRFKELGYRFPNIRGNYIIKNRGFLELINNMVKKGLERNDLRDWLVKNIKGLGYKEASHFLRNIGFTDFAIIDFHIIDLLVKHSLIEKPKTMTKKKYIDIEEVLSEIASNLDTNLAALDLYLWYLETGKILK